MQIVRARPEDAAALTTIAFAAKRHWGYPESWIRLWSEALTITPGYIGAHPTCVAVVDEKIVGFCAAQVDADEALVDHLWVSPAAMGRGIGRLLFLHMEQLLRDGGAVRLKVVADPNAEGFYHRMGATTLGHEKSTVEGQARFLPLLEKSLV